ncbi:MAG: hypothetical protein ACQ5SW_13790 [Sphaerochaetaceae bacterium]
MSKAKGLLSQMLLLLEDWEHTLVGLLYINNKEFLPATFKLHMAAAVKSKQMNV